MNLFTSITWSITFLKREHKMTSQLKKLTKWHSLESERRKSDNWYDNPYKVTEKW
jgi:hypothetical protein